jgi:hypothetical protein
MILIRGLADSNLIGRCSSGSCSTDRIGSEGVSAERCRHPRFLVTRPEQISNDVIKLMNEAEQENLDAWKQQLGAGHPHYAMVVPNRIRIALYHYFDAVIQIGYRTTDKPALR